MTLEDFQPMQAYRIPKPMRRKIGRLIRRGNLKISPKYLFLPKGETLPYRLKRVRVEL